MEWISVKEKLPPEGYSSVLMYDINSTGQNPYLGFYDSSDAGGSFYVSFSRATNVKVRPTHYIIVPNRPERSKREDRFDCEKCGSKKCVICESNSWNEETRRVCQNGCGALNSRVTD